VEQPGPWGRDGLRASHFDRAVATRLEARAGAAGIRVIAIRRPGRTPPGVRRRWALVDARPERETLRWGSYDADAELLDLPLDGAAGTADPDPLYLVCAHSRHDPCCALRGRPVAAALHEQRPGRVWECSHIGGERFAANVLLLPSGLMYGRVLPFAAPEFIAASEAGEVVGALLRGRVGLPPAAQAALAFGYEQLALRHRNDLTVLATSPVRDGRALVDLAGPHGRLQVSLRVEPMAADGLTCANSRPNVYLAYHPERIVAVED
jgi:Sucrase/ferredoxin-like